MLNSSKDSTEQLNHTTTRRCPFCMKEIPSNALRCIYCGMWMNKDTAGLSSPVSTLPISTTQQFSYAQPIWHFFLLSVLTFSVYEIYWFYRNWKQLKNYKILEISPGWRTVGLLIPIYGLYLAYTQLRDIKDFSKTAGINKDYPPVMALFLWIAINALSKLPYPFMLLSMLSVLPLLMVQDTLNSCWEKVELDLPIRTRFTGGEIAIIIIGGIFLTLAVICA